MNTRLTATYPALSRVRISKHRTRNARTLDRLNQPPRSGEIWRHESRGYYKVLPSDDPARACLIHCDRWGNLGYGVANLDARHMAGPEWRRIGSRVRPLHWLLRALSGVVSVVVFCGAVVCMVLERER